MSSRQEQATAGLWRATPLPAKPRFGPVTRWLARAALGASVGAGVLHPSSMFIMEMSAPSMLGSWQHPLLESFSPAHVPMAAFFAVLGALVGTALHYFLELLLAKTREELRERLARERLEAMHQMAGAVCHEFGQPLSIIALYAALLEEKTPDTTLSREAITAIDESAKRMTILIHRLQHITTDATMPYPGGTRIVDLEAASTDEQPSDSSHLRAG